MKENSLQKIAITGAPLNTANMGVTALAFSLIKLLRCADKNNNIGILCAAKKAEVRQIDLGDENIYVKITNYRKSFKSKINQHIVFIFVLAILYRLLPVKFIQNVIRKVCPFINEIISSRFVASIHGGDSFSDMYGTIRFFWIIIIDILVIILNKPLFLLPQTFGPFKNKIVKKTAEYIIRSAMLVYSRDKNGKEQLQSVFNNSIDNSKISTCPDVAFCLPYPKNDISNFIPEKHMRKTLIGLNINGLMFNGGYSRKNMFDLALNYSDLLYSIIEYFISIENTYMLLIPHNIAVIGDIESDLESCNTIYSKLREESKLKVQITEFGITPSQIKGGISQCDFFIGSRMHACIGGLSSLVPTIGIAYSKKFIGVFEYIGLSDLVVDACIMDAETALAIIVKQFDRRYELQQQLTKTIPLIKTKIKETFKNMHRMVI